jgi:uncharacterized membrane protein
MVDGETLLDSGLAHVVAIVLGAVGVTTLLAGGTTAGAAWFWLFYLLIWAAFLDLFDDGPSWWQKFGDESEEIETESHEKADDPVAVLRHRYAAGEIDDTEFEARLDALLETPETQAELETERN